MATLTAEQVAAAAMLGGFPAQAIPTAVAVAYGESTFSTTEANSCCTGLWQIHRTAHADKIKAVGGVEKLTDPVINAKLANQIYAGDWCGGRAPNGHCQKYEAYGLDNAGKSWAEKQRIGVEAYQKLQADVAAGKTPASILGTSGGGGGLGLPSVPGLGAVTDTAGALMSGTKAIVDTINKVGAWVADPQSWVRVAEVVGGLVLVIIGLRITFSSQIDAASQKIIGAVTGGKAAVAKAAAASATKGQG